MIPTSGIDLFFEDLRRQCKEHGIKLKFTRGKYVHIEKGIMSSGYFDSEYKVLAVGKNRPDYLSLIVHESSHIDQWIEKSKIWTDEDKCGNNIVDSWVTGEDHDRRKLKRAFNNVIRLELDCERRSIQKIIEYDLPINLSSYIQKANSYLLYHHRVLATREWRPGVHESISVTNVMPNRMMKDSYYLGMPKRFEKYFVEAGF